MLGNIGVKKRHGTEMRTDDNLYFHIKFSSLNVIMSHFQYWKRKEKRYKDLIIDYEDLMYVRFQQKIVNPFDTKSMPDVFPLTLS